MQRRLAHGLALCFLVASLGAALQGPNISEATPAPNTVRGTSEVQNEARNQAGKTGRYQVGTASWYGPGF